MLKGRLGLETGRIPHVDRHGLLWLSQGRLSVEEGTLRFVTAGSPELAPGAYSIPFQGVSLLLLGPGCSITQDVFRLLARHGTGLAAVGEDGTRLYTAPPLGSGASRLARRQADLWKDDRRRMEVVLRMYEWRMGTRLPSTDLNSLRGMEGARVKETYVLIARKYGVPWSGRRYDRANPQSADLPNQAINHVATAVESAAMIAVAATATIPQLGFIHEDSAHAWALDVADLFRERVTLPAAFDAVVRHMKAPEFGIERWARRMAAERFRGERVIPAMIDRIKELIGADDGCGDT